MESTNQDDDSPFESKDDKNGMSTAENQSTNNIDFKRADDEQTAASSLGLVVEQLKSIAETGIVHVDWPSLQQALKNRLDDVIERYLERNPDCKEEQYQEPNVGKFNLENSKDEIHELIASFSEAPFTIQRICELLYSPFKYYDKTSTFLRGLEKNLRVISSNEWPKSPGDDPVVAQDIENNCKVDNTINQTPPDESSRQHENMNQCEDQQQTLSAQAPVPSETPDTQPSASSSVSSTSPSPSSSEPPSQAPSAPKELTY